jgi:hypothetical protein
LRKGQDLRRPYRRAPSFLCTALALPAVVYIRNTLRHRGVAKPGRAKAAPWDGGIRRGQHKHYKGRDPVGPRPGGLTVLALVCGGQRGELRRPIATGHWRRGHLALDF